jgi:hypothetical protein
MADAILTQKELKEYLHYNSDTGIFTWALKVNNKKPIGSKAGNVNKIGYCVIRINSKAYLAHRLVWLYVYGHFPQSDIDHINLIKSDNKLINLRLATHTENMRNRKVQKNNKSGFKGVCFHKGNKKWHSQCTVNGKQYNLGFFSTPEEASIIYQRFAEKHFKEFYKQS